MTGYNNPTWYLCVLIQCYLVFYLMLWIEGKLRRKVRTTISCVGIFAVVFILHYFNILQDSTYRGLEAFFIGVAVCDLKDVLAQKKWIPVIVAILSVVVLIIAPSHQRWILLLLTFPALLLAAINWKGTKEKKTTEFLNKVSFEVYIWHYPLMAMEQMLTRLTNLELIRSRITMMAFTLLVWLIAYLLYRYVEMPLNRFIKKGTT